MISKEQHTGWLKKEKCLQLQKRWGDYDEFVKMPNIPGKIAVVHKIQEVAKKLKVGDTIMEVGCGAGHFMWALKDTGMKLVGLDYSPHMLELVDEQFKKTNCDLTLIQGSCWDIELPDDSVDFSYQVDVCMHIGGSWDAIKEMIRISRKYVVFTGPSFETFDNMMDKKLKRTSWAVSTPLLIQELEIMKSNDDIKNYDFAMRKASQTYQHKI